MIYLCATIGLYGKFRNDWTTDMHVTDERYFAILLGISYNATATSSRKSFDAHIHSSRMNTQMFKVNYHHMKVFLSLTGFGYFFPEIWCGDMINYVIPVYGVATICHQVRWLRWGHPSLFHTATSLLIWYKLFCVRDISYRINIWMEFINMFVYAQSGTHGRFNW